MKGYVVCVYKNITNEEKLKEYAIEAKAAVEKHKGQFLIRGGQSTIKEGDKSPEPWLSNFHHIMRQILFINQKSIRSTFYF